MKIFNNYINENSRFSEKINCESNYQLLSVEIYFNNQYFINDI